MPQGCPIGALGEALRTEAHTVAGSEADLALVVLGVTLDSRTVAPGDLYAALPGAHVHGARFAGQAGAAWGGEQAVELGVDLPRLGRVAADAGRLAA